MNIQNLAFQFMGMLTDERRLIVIRSLGRSAINHAIFAHHLTVMGHANDWLTYLRLMGAVPNKP